MNEEFRNKILAAFDQDDAHHYVLELIEYEYEFKCQSFVYAGPGHQSRHTCEYHRPHSIEGEHSDFMYEWEGTSVEEDLGPRIINGKDYGRHTKLISNAKHRGDNSCGH